MPAFDDPASRPFARMTGALYLLIAAAGFFAILYVPSQLNVAEDPAQTFANIAARRGLFHAGLLGDVVMMTAEIFVSAMLFLMFRPVSEALSLSAAFARLMMVAVMAAMLFFHAGAIALADAHVPLGSFSAAQRVELAGLLRHVHDAGVWVWQVFFSLHLMLLGTLVLRSGAFPRVIGAGLVLGAGGYLLDSVQMVAFPGNAALIAVKSGLLGIVTLAEIGFALWLLTIGPRPRPRAVAA